MILLLSNAQCSKVVQVHPDHDSDIQHDDQRHAAGGSYIYLEWENTDLP